MKKRSAHMKDLAFEGSLGVLNFSFTPDNKKIYLSSLDAFPQGICGEGRGRCCWRYEQLSWWMGYDSETAIKSDKTGSYYRTCDACEKRWGWNTNQDDWYACDDNW